MAQCTAYESEKKSARRTELRFPRELIEGPETAHSTTLLKLGKENEIILPTMMIGGRTPFSLILDHQRLKDERFTRNLKQLLESDSLKAAITCERFQTFMIHRLGPWLRKDLSKDIRHTDNLNFFRLAQRIRNEHDTARQHPPADCLFSYEDIISSGRGIEHNDTVPFMVQCIMLKLVDECSLRLLYADLQIY